MANWFDTAFLWPKMLRNSESRDRLFNDIRNGEGYAAIGSPLHGLTAGAEMTKLGSVHRAKETRDRIADGQNPFSSEFIRGTAHDQGHNVQDAFKENWPVLAFWGGGAVGDAYSGLTDAFSGGSALGGGEGGASAGLLGEGAGSVATGAGFGLLGQAQPQQPQAAPVQPKQPDSRAALKMQQEMQIQALRQKPNKTLEEWKQLQSLVQNQGLLA